MARTRKNSLITYSRTLDVRSQKVGEQFEDLRVDFARQPWLSLPPDTLRNRGYVYDTQDGSRLYNAPGLDALLAEGFLNDHCMRIARSSTVDRLGIDFEPIPSRTVPEIRGTIWLNRLSNELIAIDFAYTRIGPDEERLAGGTLSFVRMHDGTWAISRWQIRMPVVTSTPVYGPNLQILRDSVRVDSIKVVGGDLVAVTTIGFRQDTLWSQQPLTLRGVVVDSIGGGPLSSALVSVDSRTASDTTDSLGVFAIDGVLPGRHTLTVSTASLDSVFAQSRHSVLLVDSATRINLSIPRGSTVLQSLCPSNNQRAIDRRGVLIGTVRDTNSGIVGGASVTVRWREVGARGSPDETKSLSTRTTDLGIFRFCGLPSELTVTLDARKDAMRSAAPDLRIGQQVVVRKDLTLGAFVAPWATFTGSVTDTAGNAIPDAEVLMPMISLGARTRSDGSFRIDSVPPGLQAVLVRRVGFGPLDAKLEFSAGQFANRQIVLTRITLLDSMTTTARPYRDPGMEEFEQRRRIGIGHFVTREEIKKREGSLLASFMEQMPGLRIASAPGGDWPSSTNQRCNAAVSSGRGGSRRAGGPPQAVCGIFYAPTSAERAAGIPVACFSKVYLDNQLMNPGTPTPPFNLREVPPTQVEAIEYYSRPAEVPAKYNGLNTACGLVIIHTIRPR
jgi:hypothetical protein